MLNFLKTDKIAEIFCISIAVTVFRVVQNTRQKFHSSRFKPVPYIHPFYSTIGSTKLSAEQDRRRPVTRRYFSDNRIFTLGDCIKVLWHFALPILVFCFSFLCLHYKPFYFSLKCAILTVMTILIFYTIYHCLYVCSRILLD